jgi:plastocyanin
VLAWFPVPAAGAGVAPARTHVSVPAQIQVNSGDNWFNPEVGVVARGGTVTWAFVGNTHHTATDTTGMDLYDSGSKLTGTFSHTFPAAGVYSFYCILHPQMSGRIHVPMRATPRSGGRSTIFTLTWASAAAPDGYAYDVQLKRPGSGWSLWQAGITVSDGGFDPDAGRGTYRFQARLHQVGSDATSMWSDTVPIVVG